MIVITEGCPRVGPAALSGKERDTLRLAWEERRWTRKRVTTTGGREVALALPTGSMLRPGDVIAVEAAMEQLLSRLGVRWARRQAVFDPLGGVHRHEPRGSALDGHGDHESQPRRG